MTEPGGAGGAKASPSLSWGWGEALAALGCVMCVVAAAALPWARASVTWRSILFGNDIDLGIHTFRLTDSPWLAGALMVLAALCLLGMPWRRQAGNIAIAASLLLLGGSVAYIISLVENAFDWLGIYEQLMELVRGLPTIGPVVESVIRERLSVAAVPHAGVYVFVAATLLILTGGILIKRRMRIHV